MSEQKFIDELEKAGLDKTEIDEYLGAFYELIKDFPKLTLEEWLNQAIKTHNETKNDPADIISFS